MKTQRLFLAMASLVVAIPLQLTAQAPTGTFNYPGLGAGTLAIWDVSGSYNAGGTIGGDQPIELSFLLTIVQDGKGKLSGSGSGVAVQIGTDAVTGSYTAKGTLTGAGANARVNLNVKLSGNGFIEGAQRTYQGTINYSLSINPVTRHLVGTGTGTAKASGFSGSAPISADVDVPLPGGMDGSWSLTLTLQPAGKKYGGSATMVLSNGRNVPATVKGTYVAATGDATLQLKGTGTGSGAVVNLKTAGNPPVLGSIVGTVLGNSIR